jgi:hypothetical protein
MRAAETSDAAGGDHPTEKKTADEVTIRDYH